MSRGGLGLAALITCGLFASCSGIQLEVFPWGEVEINAPVDAGSVTISTVGSGDELWIGPVENGAFAGRMQAWKLWGSPKDVLVTATGGQSAGKCVTGTLKAYVPAYDPSQPVRVNLISTIVAAFMDVKHVSCQEAHDKVFDFLQIPRDNPVVTEGHLVRNAPFFDPERFMAQAETAGGMDAYIKELVQNHVGTGEAQSFSSLQGPMAGGAATEIGSFLLEKVVGGIWDGFIAYDTDAAMGWVLSSYGFGDDSNAQFEVIDQTLEEMNGKLDTIENDLAVISGQLDALLAAVNLSRDEIIQQIVGCDISEPQNVINNQYYNLSTNFPHGDGVAHTSTGCNNAADFATSMTTSGRCDIDQKLASLNAGILGSDVGTTGFLDACTNVLIDKAMAGTDVLDCYKVLESYFAELLSVEGKGLVLMTEALHFQKGDINRTQKDYYGTASQFLTKFQGCVDAQKAKYMSCVDRLVVSQINVRTDLANPPQFLPDGAGSVYERADFFAMQLTTAPFTTLPSTSTPSAATPSITPQPAGLIVRVIGTPAQVMAMYSAGFYVRETAVDTVCPQSGSGTATTTETDYLLTPVTVNGNGYNTYPATLPNNSQKGYLEWSLLETVNQFQLQKNIVVVKLALSDTVLSTQTYTDSDACSSGAGTTHEVSWTIEPGLQGPTVGSPTDLLRTYDDQFNPAETGTQYACQTLFHRQLPGSWRSSQAWVSKQGGNQLGCLFDPATMSQTPLLTIRDFTRTARTYYDDGAPDTIYYKSVNFEANGSQSIDFMPHSPVDACTLCVRQEGKIGLALSANLNTSTVLQGIMLAGGLLGPSYGAGGTVSNSPSTQPPAWSIPVGAVVTAPAFSATSLLLTYDVKGSGTWEDGKEPGYVVADGHIQYSALEVFPAN